MNNNFSFNSQEFNFPSPKYIKNNNILINKNYENICTFRKDISNIISRNNNKLLLICGPCSIHNIEESIEYSNLLKKISLEVNDYIYIIMRTYFEKPRTSIGWKGFINDPNLNNTFDMELGINKSIEFLNYLLDIELPSGIELLNPLILKYIGDYVSWISIGARTSESQIHREICSSLNIPIGFKNSTDGSIFSSINSIKSCYNSHVFLNINEDGIISLIKSKGNKNTNIILRGGYSPNYYNENINEYINIINKNNLLNTSIIVDCSHNNSNKDYRNQGKVFNYVLNNILNGNDYIKGLMIESYIKEGNQNLDNNKLKYGLSITDSCIGWNETEDIIYNLYNKYKNYILSK
ncbi:3-deoxy-7-phosphoheptulonate synthase [Candidatus Nardonella dryophthoridicola]|uniref:3-deoxy-7-phosphoheptulonate synthase n=1 Tax=Candidatus Nardonella dryophthoridicola TaxID=1971485 RepID=UPI001AD86E1C|nr:3-deoxy-7-phosphoheptulonate synthase [Candidatus Nardonella dryophthoridicola]QTJ62894.1 3-deoxy-7-phosphoheptulonate synthase [Candidatus Nardonella dryophthoridicola]